MAWGQALGHELDDFAFQVWPDVAAPERIEFALVWEPELGLLKRFPNLKGVVSLGAGVEHLMSDPSLPPGIPISRIVDPSVTAQMSEYAVYAVLRHHRLMPSYGAAQQAHEWRPRPPPNTAGATVGILGLGVIGRDIAAKLRALGFPVLGWSRTAKNLDGIRCFAGDEGLWDMLPKTQILICILPLTPQTRGIINSRTLAALPAGADIINLARGGHLVADDLLAAIESGHIAGATLDVFAEEPLPPDHPFWPHPQIAVTPHIAAIGVAAGAAARIAESIRRAGAGRPLLDQIDRELGY